MPKKVSRGLASPNFECALFGKRHRINLNLTPRSHRRCHCAKWDVASSGCAKRNHSATISVEPPTHTVWCILDKSNVCATQNALQEGKHRVPLEINVGTSGVPKRLTTVGVIQWQSGPFMREDNFLGSWAWPCFYNSMLDDYHSYSIQTVQCHIDGIRLLHDIHIFTIPIMRLLQPSLWMNVYNVGAHRSIWQIWFKTTLHTLACI